MSIIVPVYNVEAYLDECLESILDQSYREIEVVVVDDGSPDGSAAIAARYAEADPRVTLVSQPNGGLGNARNTGVKHAHGTYLTFVDSDDRLPRNAIEKLVDAASAADADISVGALKRFNADRSWEPEWVHEVHGHVQVLSSVVDHLPLLRNNYTVAKLYCTAWWRAADARFREGVAYEDQPVVTRLLVEAGTIAVIRDVVYHYRAREDESSISQQTGTVRDLRDRAAAWSATIEWFHHADVDERVQEAWFVTVLQTHLHWYLNNPAIVDPEYWSLLRQALEEIDAHAPEGTTARVHPARRVASDILRSGTVDEALAYSAAGGYNPALYSYDIRGGEAVMRPMGEGGSLQAAQGVVPHRLVGLVHQLRQWRWEGEGESLAFVLGGYATLENVDRRTSPQTTTLVVEDQSTGRRWEFPTSPSDDPDLLLISNRRQASYDGAAFTVRVPVADLVRSEISEGPTHFFFSLRVTSGDFAKSFPLRRVSRWGTANAVRPRLGPGGTRVVPTRLAIAGVSIRDVRYVGRYAKVHDGVLTVEIEPTMGDAPRKMRLVDRWEGKSRPSAKLTAVGPRCRGSIELPADLVDGPEETSNSLVLYVSGAGAKRSRVFVEPALADHEARDDLLALRGRGGWLTVEPGHAPVVCATSVHVAGQVVQLGLATRMAGGAVIESVQLTDAAGIVRARAQVGADGSAAVTLTRDEYRFGTTWLPQGSYRVSAVMRGQEDSFKEVQVVLDEALSAFPPVVQGDGMLVTAGVTGYGVLHIDLRAPLAARERGAFNQVRMLEMVRAVEPEKLEGALFRSYFGEAVTCNGLAVTQELQRRGARIPLYWAVRDGSVPVPEGVIPVIHGSEEWYRRLQTARYYFDNMFQPDYHTRPDGQVMVQTFHGYPFKVMGHTLWTEMGLSAQKIASYDGRAADWSYLVSPAVYATPLLRREFAYDGEVLETGYPRNDVLRSSQAPVLRETVRASLGITADQTAILYAPTFRDNLSKDGHRADFLDLMDTESVARELGPGFRLLVRGHAFNARSRNRRAFADSVIDVTDYPEVADLYLAADVAVVDYSSLRFDFGVTGKPMIFLVPDLAEYEEMRGGLFDYAPTAPGPWVTGRRELLEALRDHGGLGSRYAREYEMFQSQFLSLEDGYAAARVVDAVFVPRGDAPAR